MISPRENLLQTLRCENPQWIPVCPYLFPNENPTEGIPGELEQVFAAPGTELGQSIMELGAYLGASDYMLPVPPAATLVSDTCPAQTERTAPGTLITTLHTPRGDLRQVSQTFPGYPGLTTERYLKNLDDAHRLIEYFRSLRVELVPGAVTAARQVREQVGDQGVVFCRTFGTPLGMCYRVYASITDLLYLIADHPHVAGQLFATMEEKYLEAYGLMLREVPEIDAFLGMDDTSTTLVSPDLFRSCNVDLTNTRADLCHAHGRIYLHHSCGLLRTLLPVYRETRVDGVDAFTTPPIGDVGYADGRQLLGPRYSLVSSLAGGLASVDDGAVRGLVAERFHDARAAGSTVFHVGGAHLTFPVMEMIMVQALQMQAAHRR